jgi:hypothetical protein
LRADVCCSLRQARHATEKFNNNENGKGVQGRGARGEFVGCRGWTKGLEAALGFCAISSRVPIASRSRGVAGQVIGYLRAHRCCRSKSRVSSRVTEPFSSLASTHRHPLLRMHGSHTFGVLSFLICSLCFGRLPHINSRVSEAVDRIRAISPTREIFLFVITYLS